MSKTSPVITSAHVQDGLTLRQVQTFLRRVETQLPASQVKIQIRTATEPGDETGTDTYWLEASVPPHRPPATEARNLVTMEWPFDLQKVWHLCALVSGQSLADLFYTRCLDINAWSIAKIQADPCWPSNPVRDDQSTQVQVHVHVPAKLKQTVEKWAKSIKTPVSSVWVEVGRWLLARDLEGCPSAHKGPSKKSR